MKTRLVPIGWDAAAAAMNADKMDRAINNALEGTSKAIRADYLVTTLTWLHQPKFLIWTRVRYERNITTEDEIYGYVSGGTPPHEIRAKRPGGTLAFASQFSAKTRPNAIRSNKGSSGGPTVFTARVWHPGTAPRNFDTVISDKWASQWPRNLERAIMAEFH